MPLIPHMYDKAPPQFEMRRGFFVIAPRDMHGSQAGLAGREIKVRRAVQGRA